MSENGVSRRTFLRGLAVSAAFGPTACAAPAAAVAASPLLGWAFLGTVATTTALAFNTKLGENLADAIPDAFTWVYERARDLADSGPVLGGYVDTEVPDNQLHAAVTAVLPQPVDADGDVRATTVQAITGAPDLREVPAILQLGINWLVLHLAGYTGNPLDVDQDFHSADLEYQRTRNTIYRYELVEGSDSLTEQGTFRALTMNGDKTIEVRWEPSMHYRTTHSTLSFRKGILMEGQPDYWYPESIGGIAVPYRYVFEPEVPTR